MNLRHELQMWLLLVLVSLTDWTQLCVIIFCLLIVNYSLRIKYSKMTQSSSCVFVPVPTKPCMWDFHIILEATSFFINDSYIIYWHYFWETPVLSKPPDPMSELWQLFKFAALSCVLERRLRRTPFWVMASGPLVVFCVDCHKSTSFGQT